VFGSLAVIGLLLMAGSASAIIYSPSSLTFDKQKLGTSSPPQVVTVGGGYCGPDHPDGMGNIVPGPCFTEPTDVAVSGTFVITANTCPAQLSSPLTTSIFSCSVSVAFAPTALGASNGFLRLASNPSIVGVPLSGTGCVKTKRGKLKCAKSKKRCKKKRGYATAAKKCRTKRSARDASRSGSD
jgi:hypothetical protein